MDLLTLGDPILRKRSILVTEIDRGILDFVHAMFDKMHSKEGIGLAAVQMGELKRIFVTHVLHDNPRVFINPEIIETSMDLSKLEEGCLSIPGINAEIVRPSGVKVQAWNEMGKLFTLSADGMLARAIQHELDHLNGKLFIDYLDSKKRGRILRDYDQKVCV